MRSSLSLQEVLQRSDVWRGGALAAGESGALPSGLPELDAVLPGGGWPRGALAEVLLAMSSIRRVGVAGVGELALLLPALARHTQTGGFAALVAPPARPHAPAWAATGIDLAHLLVVDPPVDPGDAASRSRDALWACEQTLKSGGVGLVVAWLPQADAAQLKRLQLAAERGRASGIVIRPEACAQHASPAPLRLQLAGSGEGVRVRLLKRRGPPLTAPVDVAVGRPRRTPRPERAGLEALRPVCAG